MKNVKKKLFVLVRNDISLGQQAAQSCHAVAEWLLYVNSNWKNDTIVCLHTDPARLELQMKKLDLLGVTHVAFREPDMDYKITAIACECGDWLFKRFKLIGA